MLHDTRPFHPEHIRHRRLQLINVQMNESNTPIERLVNDGTVHARDQELEELDGGCTALGCVGRVVDVVRGDIGQVCGLGVLKDVELLDEVEEDGVLLAGGGRFRGAEWRRGCGRVVSCCWAAEDGGESGEDDGDESGEMHDLDV